MNREICGSCDGLIDDDGTCDCAPAAVADVALLRQALESLRGYRREMGCEQPCDAEVALRERLERKNENAN